MVKSRGRMREEQKRGGKGRREEGGRHKIENDVLIV